MKKKTMEWIIHFHPHFFSFSPPKIIIFGRKKALQIDLNEANKMNINYALLKYTIILKFAI